MATFQDYVVEVVCHGAKETNFYQVTSKFLSVLFQAALFLAFDAGGLFSGRLIAIFSSLLAIYPWILGIFPPILTIRGDISGILSGKLGTMLHTGQIKTCFRRNTDDFYNLISAILVLTLVDTLGIGFISFLMNLFVSQAALPDLPFYIFIPTVVCLEAVAFTLPITLAVAFESFKRGLDPDLLVYPVMSTLNDVIVTFFLVVNIYLVLSFTLATLAFNIIVCLLFILAALLMIKRFSREKLFKRTLKEGGPVVFFSSLFGSFNGMILARFRGVIEGNLGVLILYPVLIDALGDIGSATGSMATTKIALGYVSSFKSAVKTLFVDLSAVEAAAFFMHAIYGSIGFLLSVYTNLTVKLGFMVKVAVTCNLLGFAFATLLSLSMAVLTFKRGLDPDNFVIPVVASVSDSMATLILIAILKMYGVL